MPNSRLLGGEGASCKDMRGKGGRERKKGGERVSREESIEHSFEYCPNSAVSSVQK
jgi:hypothetical protein